jgi:hypothetical protein
MTPKDDIEQYFQACGFDPQDTISVVWKGRSGALGWTTTTVEAAWKPIDGHRLVDCWISANAMTPPKDRKSRGDASDVYAIRALWADLDVEPGKMPSYPAAQAVIDEVSQLIGAQPVAIVASGHGLQPRWRIDFGDIAHHAGASDFLEHFGRIVQAVAQRHGGKADSVYDLPRIIRAPGTTNCKKIEVKVKLKLTGSRDVVRMENVIGAVAPIIEPPAPPRAITPKAEEVDVLARRPLRRVGHRLHQRGAAVDCELVDRRGRRSGPRMGEDPGRRGLSTRRAGQGRLELPH